MAYNFTVIEKKWQGYWDEHRCFRALDPSEAGDMPKAYILDMFPYPSGSGLHVGHPEGYTATDIVTRYLRMKGTNVLHPMGWDAFGLPAEQYAIKTNTHPRQTTETNIENFRRQIKMLGLSYDWEREVDTTDPAYYRWTQWIFLQLFNSYFDSFQQKAMPISHLQRELENGNYVVAPDYSIKVNPTSEGMEAIGGEVRLERKFAELTAAEQRMVIDNQRLAYTAEVPVNWCAGLGTVLSNEEVIDGKSEVGGFPVERRPMRQWMLRITAYSDRLLADLDGLNWSESLKEMQRNWIGRSIGAEVDFEIDGLAPSDEGEIASVRVFTTRPDTLYGATYLVLAPEHPLVADVTTAGQKSAVAVYQAQVAARSDRDRMADVKEKTGVFTGAYAVNPINDRKVPIWIADYVLMGYGTGAIMAVPGHDQRDWDFAHKFGLAIEPVVAKPDGSVPDVSKGAYEEVGLACNSLLVEGLTTDEAKERIIATLEREGYGKKSVRYKLRDWLFSRQRYWGEPFPILLDAEGNPVAIEESELPLRLPEIEDFKPTGTPEPPLSKAKEWLKVERDGKTYTRETKTMPQWAGSCWYYLRYIDPENNTRFIDPDKEKYWMSGGGVDLYVGGVEHAVLHLLYARFWHKVLFDLGHVSTPEPFKRLVNQGLILGGTEFHFFEDAAGKAISTTELRDIGEEATDKGPLMVGYTRQGNVRVEGKRLIEPLVERAGDGYVLRANPAVRIDARSFKMSKSRGNVVNPDDIVRDYGADVLRLYEMYMGPLEAQKPWNTRDIVGMQRFCSAVYRHLIGDDETGTIVEVQDIDVPDALNRQLHRTIKKVAGDIEGLRFNTAIAELIKLNNEMGPLEVMPRKLAEDFTLMLAPFAPHLAEEIWHRLGHPKSLTRYPWPGHDEELLIESVLELPVQVNGKLRDKIIVPADASEADVFLAAEASEKALPWLAGKVIKKRLYVPRKLVNIVVADA